MIIMIAIGVGIFLGFNIEWQSIESDTSAFFKDTNYADYRLYAETGFTEENIESIKNIDGVDAATRYLSVSVGIKDTKKSVSLNVSEKLYRFHHAYNGRRKIQRHLGRHMAL